jgi:hypothetical protein
MDLANKATAGRIASVLACLALAACGSGNAASQLVKTPEYAPAGQAKCSIQKSQSKPLVVEWPSPDRLELENTIRQGLAVVHYAGCEISLLNRCRVASRYSYLGATQSEDRIEVKDEDDLYANLPLGAASLEGKLHRAGRLTVDMNVVGRFQAERPKVWADELQGECGGATHFVYGVIVGAFDFYSGGHADVGGGVGTRQLGAGAQLSAERESLTKSGDQSACSKATSWDKSPPEGCGALIRLEVVPLEAARGVGAVPAAGGGPTAPASEPKPRDVTAPSGDYSTAAMVSVAGGSFTMGDRRDAVTVQPFRLDATEVTSDAYAACVRARGCTDDGVRCDASATFGVGDSREHPINCVDYDQATAYCRWTHKRLPTEEEWEWAARGQAAGTTYPWGDGVPASPLCWKTGQTCPVGSFPSSDAPGGIHDLAGNVWEWTSTDYKDGKERVFRGGSWHSKDVTELRAAYRNHRAGASHHSWLGFRCAAPASFTESAAAPVAAGAPTQAVAPEVRSCVAEKTARDQAYCYLKTESEDAIDPLFEIGHSVSHEAETISTWDMQDFTYAAENAGVVAAKTSDTKLYAGLQSPHRSYRLFAIIAIRHMLATLRWGHVHGADADAPVRVQRLPRAHATCLAAVADPTYGMLVSAGADCLKEIGDPTDGPALVDAIVRHPDEDVLQAHLTEAALTMSPFPKESLVKLRPVLERPLPRPWTHDSVKMRGDICKLLLREMPATPASDPWPRQAAAVAVRQIGALDGQYRKPCEQLAGAPSTPAAPRR